MYEYTSHWFLDSKSIWKIMFEEFDIKSALELGSYEGQSAVFMIEHGVEHLDCVDLWSDNSMKISGLDPNTCRGVETRFDHNITLAADGNDSCFIRKHKMSTETFLKQASSTYDLIYIDASHLAKDILKDATMSFDLLRPGGLMVFDDYDWNIDERTRPAMAIKSWADVMEPYVKEWEMCHVRQKYYIKSELSHVHT